MTDVKYRIVYVLTRTNKADDDDTDIYVGSTSQSLEQRLRIHRHDAKRPGNKNNRLYVRMNEVGIENWEILPLLGRTCDKKQAYELEKKWIRVLSADLNTYSPIREEATKKEYDANRYKVNKDAIRQQQAGYRMANKEANVSQQQVKYRKANKQGKRYYCGVCDLSFLQSSDLKRHLDTLRHSYAWLNAVD